MNLLDILKELSKLPPGAITDGLALVQEGMKVAADAKAYTEKYPQVLEMFKSLGRG